VEVIGQKKFPMAFQQRGYLCLSSSALRSSSAEPSIVIMAVGLIAHWCCESFVEIRGFMLFKFKSNPGIAIQNPMQIGKSDLV